MSPWIIDLLVQYGYAILGVIVVFQHAAVPVPGQAAYLGAAVLAGRGMLSLPIVMVVGFAASFAGYSGSYWIGQRGGRALVQRHGKWVGLTPARLAQMERFFIRHGGKTLILARFIVGVRAIGGLFAGISGHPWRAFFLMNVLGSLAWAAVFGSAGYLFGDSWEVFEGWFGRIGLIGAGGLLLVLLTLFLLSRRAKRVERADD
jgi:membrane protein DedA with SNARE-associated domain